MEMQTLSPNELHVWFADPGDFKSDEKLLSIYKTLLSQEEREQQQRFYFKKHRHQYLVSHALVRIILSHYADVAPGDWRFSKNQYGKPEIIASAEMPPLRFNLSHTEGLIMCGVVLTQDIGVDTENIERRSSPVDIADRYFSPQEVKDLYAVPELARKHRFFQYWTLKESYIKARGMGLFLPLEHFSFHLSEGEPLRLSFDARLRDDPECWQCWLLQPTPHHYAAISVCREANTSYTLVMKKTVPLREEITFDCPVIYRSCPNTR